MFASQFKLEQTELNALRDVCWFIIKFYVEIWFQCTKPLRAPRLDFQFSKDILAYRSIDKETSEVVLKKFRTQSWYLSEETIALAFFDKEVPVDEKIKMVQSLNSQPQPNRETEMFRLMIPPPQLQKMNEWSLSDFITENTRNFFIRYNIPIYFFKSDPIEWHLNDDYKRSHSKLRMIILNVYST